MWTVSSLRAALALAVIGPAGFLAANALSSPGARLADPVNATTFADPQFDNEARAPDIGGGTVQSFADGLLRFSVALPRQTGLTAGEGFGVFLDIDRNAATGDQGSEFLLAVDGKVNMLPAIDAYAWTGFVWSRVVTGGLSGRFDPGVGIVLEINKEVVHVTTSFDYVVRTSWVGGDGSLYHDFAPNLPERSFTFQVTVPTTTTTTTTTVPTTTSPQPVQKLSGRVGPGALISLTRSAKPGKATIRIDDRSTTDDFHLTGPGVNKRTGIASKGIVTWSVTLKKATYAYRSDTHSKLHGSLKVS